MKGSGMPVMGMMPMHMPTSWSTWNDHMDAAPASTSFAKGKSIRCASAMVEKIIHPKRRSTHDDPTKPNSSESNAKTKSVCASGKKPVPD